MELSRDTVKRRIERYLKTIDQGLRVPKSIRDKGLHGEAYVIDLNTQEVIKSKATLGELIKEYGLLLDGESYGA